MRVIYRVLAEDGIQNGATGQRWERGQLLEGTAITPEWAEGLLADHAIEQVGSSARKKAKAEAGA